MTQTKKTVWISRLFIVVVPLIFLLGFTFIIKIVFLWIHYPELLPKLNSPKVVNFSHKIVPPAMGLKGLVKTLNHLTVACWTGVDTLPLH